ncbi:hypothetical protein [Litchfieldia alkalitelluris]|uniref:hypothetical protein n=1 Tax=Litchfieldia alkalitelluris TaxID=304268 RepID=UPI00099608B2|nr:hypothetical protein [Litchfieldia alkalitelluris]
MHYEGEMLETKKLSRNVKIYTVLIALLPIIAIYASGVPGINLGELFLVAFWAYSLIFVKKGVFNSYSQVNILIFFGWYAIFSTFISMFFDSSQINDVMVRTIRFCFYLFVIVYLSRKFFSLNYAIKVIKFVSIAGTFYIIIQNISYRFFGLILKGFLPFIPVYTSQYETYDYAGLYETIFYRPTSFFLEPAHYSQYVLIALVLFLFKEEFNIKNIISSVFITIGVLLSTSGQGLIIATLIWFVYMLNLLLAKREIWKKRLLGITFPIITLAVLPFLLRSEIIQNNISRILSSGSATSTAVGARTSGYLTFIMEDSIFIKLFGAGFGNTPHGVWFAGLSYILYCLGIIGFLFLLGIFLIYYLKANSKFIKMLIFVCFMLSVSAEIINSYWIVFMFSLFCYNGELVPYIKASYHVIDRRRGLI